MKKKLVYIAPHLSTGGLPQYLFKQIELLNDEFDIYCVEWENVTGGVLVIQRNRIQKILGTKLITLHDDKHELFTVLNDIQPDIIHLQEIPELFMQRDVADKLYSPSRDYIIIETSHDSSFDTSNKMYLPDKFFLVSQYQINQYKTLDIPCVLAEHPIEYKSRTKTREQALLALGLDPALKHVINVGLFTPRKNQAEIIEYAKALQGESIQFHFLGNHADNFKFYWEPLMKDFPPNCKWWNERDDVDAFYEAADLFLFTSRGHSTDKETMPLVIREAIGWKIPSLIYNLPVYLDYFDKYENIKYLSEDFLTNVSKIKEQLDIKDAVDPVVHNECIVVTTYIQNKKTEDITIATLKQLKQYNLPIILTSHTPVSVDIQAMVDYYVYDNKNILTGVSHVNTLWHDDDHISMGINLNREYNNVSYHGPAAHTDIYNGVSLAHKLGFSSAHVFAYDIVPTSETCFVEARQALQTKKAFMHHTVEVGNELEKKDIHTLRTYWFAIDTEFFINYFPQILSEKDYIMWVTDVGSETNGLENIYYNTMRKHMDHVELLTSTTHLFESVTYSTKSEISSILPIEGDSEHCIFYITTNFGEDSRLFKLYINGELAHSAVMGRGTWYFSKHKISDLKTIKTELWYTDEDRLYSTKIFVVDEDYINTQLKLNGYFKFKTIVPPDQPQNYEFDVSWNLAEQRLYYTSKFDINFPVRVTIKEYKSTAVLWSFVTDHIPANNVFYTIPIPKHVQDYENEPYFAGVTFTLYNENTGEQLVHIPLIQKDIDVPVVSLSNRIPYRMNYIEFFLDKKYSKWIDKSHDVVIDIGANIGIFSEYMLRNGYANRITAIECDSTALADLQRNFDNNPHVTIVPNAIHHLKKQINFYEFSANPAVSSTIDPQNLPHPGTGLLCDRVRTVETITLDELVHAHGTLDLVKIDIEGQEYALIENTNNTVFTNIKSLLIECHSFGPEYRMLLDKLLSLGYIIDGLPSHTDAAVYSTIYAHR